MGKDDKEESGFGFKDAAKAEETLRLLQAHEPSYRRLTVRGLLGRAKRTLSMTKAEDKIKNIKEAMAVFENWLAELDKDKKTEKKKEKTDEKEKNGDKEGSDVEMEEPKKKEPADKVQGLGFKDKEAAEGTIRALEGRDPEYQQLAVKGLLGSAKRVLAGTRDETKVSNIKEAMAVLEKFLEDFESQHMMRQNNPYLSLGIVRTCLHSAADATEQQKSFIAAYASAGGEYKRLRTVAVGDGDTTWDIVRNTALAQLKEKYTEAELFNEKDEPTKEHLEMLLWAYSPEPARVKKLIKETKETDTRKRKSSPDESESPSKRSKD